MPLRTDSRCRSCHAPIAWVKMAGTGKSNPLDPEPSPKGNIVVSDLGAAAVGVSEADRLRAEGYSLYLSHFATCPNAKSHKKPAVQPVMDFDEETD